MRKSERFFNILVILMLVIMTLGSPSLVAQAKNDNQEPKADPRLLQMAEENPKDTFMVIVQREMKNRDLPDEDPEAAVEKGGGRVKKQLEMIESFSAELTGKDITKLAKNPKVRWISADAPMVSTAAPGMESVRDEFTSKSYDGNNGTATWTSNWVEAGETTNATSGLIQVVENSSCADGSG